ncbi:MAG: carboxylating nicotinate-nucleotide diphosphorylase, partial [Pseudomonadota bacterium]
MPPTFPLDDAALATLVEQTLSEDVGSGDITAESCVPETAKLVASINAREAGVLCGAQVVCAIFAALDDAINIAFDLADGDVFSANARLAVVRGPARAVLTGERSALNTLQVFCGIAAQAKRYAAALEGTHAELLDTRKTIPGFRLLTKYAAICGGAVNHRIGLFDAILIKDNHIAVAGSIEAAIAACKQSGHAKIQVECDTLEQAAAAVSAGATSLLLDNMTTDMLRQAT